MYKYVRVYVAALFVGHRKSSNLKGTAWKSIGGLTASSLTICSTALFVRPLHFTPFSTLFHTLCAKSAPCTPFVPERSCTTLISFSCSGSKKLSIEKLLCTKRVYCIEISWSYQYPFFTQFGLVEHCNVKLDQIEWRIWANGRRILFRSSQWVRISLLEIDTIRIKHI